MPDTKPAEAEAPADKARGKSAPEKAPGLKNRRPLKTEDET